MRPDILLGGDEPTTWLKLDEALRKAAEACDGARYGDVMAHLRHGIEAATEFGVHRSDGRWAAVAERIERARTMMAGITSAQFVHAAPALAEMFGEMHESVALMRAGRMRR